MNKSFHLNPWFSFIVLCAATLLGIFAGSILWIFIFGFGALIAYPNEKFQTLLNEKKQQAIYLLTGLFYLGVIIAIIAGCIWVVGAMFSGVMNIGKYEGRSAREWYYEYDYEVAKYDTLKNCVEENSSYYGFEDYDELQDQLDEIEGCL